MNFLAGLADPGWLAFALLFLAVLLYLFYRRRLEERRIIEKFPRERIVLSSFGTNYYGLESEPGGPLRSIGALVLLKDRLYYRARFAKRELTIPGAAITYIGVTDTHKGRPLHQLVVAIRFLNAEGKEEKAAFRLPLPAQCTAAIKVTLIGGRAMSPSRPTTGSGAPAADYSAGPED